MTPLVPRSRPRTVLVAAGACWVTVPTVRISMVTTPCPTGGMTRHVDGRVLVMRPMTVHCDRTMQVPCARCCHCASTLAVTVCRRAQLLVWVLLTVLRVVQVLGWLLVT